MNKIIAGALTSAIGGIIALIVIKQLEQKGVI